MPLFEHLDTDAPRPSHPRHHPADDIHEAPERVRPWPRDTSIAMKSQKQTRQEAEYAAFRADFEKREHFRP